MHQKRFFRIHWIQFVSIPRQLFLHAYFYWEMIFCNVNWQVAQTNKQTIKCKQEAWRWHLNFSSSVDNHLSKWASIKAIISLHKFNILHIVGPVLFIWGIAFIGIQIKISANIWTSNYSFAQISCSFIVELIQWHVLFLSDFMSNVPLYIQARLHNKTFFVEFIILNTQFTTIFEVIRALFAFHCVWLSNQMK